MVTLTSPVASSQEPRRIFDSPPKPDVLLPRTLPSALMSREMVIVRGVNVYPAALDDIVRGHAAIDEYEAFVRTDRSMAELVLRVEIRRDGRHGAAESLAADVHARLQLRPTVEVAEPGSLPRYELKSGRFKGVVDE